MHLYPNKTIYLKDKKTRENSKKRTKQKQKKKEKIELKTTVSTL